MPINDDCKALALVFNTIERLGSAKPETSGGLQAAHMAEVVDVDLLKREYPQRFRRAAFVNAELDAINRCAYWDYQRSKVYVRTSESVRRRFGRKLRANRRRLSQ